MCLTMSAEREDVGSKLAKLKVRMCAGALICCCEAEHAAHHKTFT